MTKITLTSIANLQNENTAVSAINTNNTTLVAAIDNTLSRNGLSPNQMEANLDMNSFRILNLPQPVSNSEPMRLQDLEDFISGSFPQNLHLNSVTLGDNIEDFLTRHITTQFPVIVTDRLVNWTNINDQTVSDFTTLAPPDSISNLYASFASNLMSTTANDYGHMIAFEDLMRINGTGTLTDQSSFFSLPTINGPVTNRRAVRIGEASGTGVIANNLGISIAPLSRGTVNYAIQVEGTTASTFGGTIFGTHLGAGSIAPFVAAGTLPAYGWTLSTNGTNQKNWDIAQNSTSLLFRALTDDNVTSTNWMTVTRGSGVAVSSVSIANFVATGSFTATGLVGNASLTNSSITINGTSISLGASGTVTAAPSGSAGGDLTGTYPNPTLAGIITAGGPTGSATVAPIITYDAKGRLTAVSSATITPAASSITSGAALTKVDDTNVTLTLGGTPTSALLAAASLTLGWSGQLSVARGGTGISAFGTGVATALGINVGSAGAFVTFNGAGGTPSSIVLTNATGTAASLTAGSVTTNANLTGAITSSGNSTSLGSFTSANLASALTDETGSGPNVFGTSPTITTPNIVGTTAAGNATAGSVGEFVSAAVELGSPVALTTVTAKTITSISLTAGDWDVSANFGITGNAATTVSYAYGGLSTTNNTLPTNSSDQTAKVYAGSTVFAVANAEVSAVTPSIRVNVSSTTTVYLVGFVSFAINSCSGFGKIEARRRR